MGWTGSGGLPLSGGTMSGGITFSGAQPQITATLGLGCRSSLAAGSTGTDFKFDTAGVTRTAGVLFGFYNNATSVLRHATDVARLYVTGSGGLSVESGSITVAGALIVSNSAVTQSASNTSVSVAGNRSAADAGADVILKSTADRSAGKLASFQKQSTEMAYVNWDGKHGVIAANTQTTVGAAGGASALPATPTGYELRVVDGTTRAFPYYAAS